MIFAPCVAFSALSDLVGRYSPPCIFACLLTPISTQNTAWCQLSRIILVSHQEEFASAFPNRYSLKLVEGASHVSLMEEE